MRFFISVLMMSLSTASVAEVYKWKGADGKTHFGDRPPSQTEAETVRIRSFSGSAEVGTSEVRVKNVVMYSTIWCGVCKHARQYFNTKGISFTEYDVEKSDVGRADYQRLKGRGVPIILVGERRMNGFDSARLDEWLKDSAK